jgi:hypothetical protein
MFGQNFRRQKPGKRIAARTINEPTKQVERFARLRVGLNLAQVEVNSTPLIRDISSAPVRKLARIIARGSGAVYSWNEVVPGGAVGSFVDGTDSGTTSASPAVEQNGNTNVVAGTRVLLALLNGTWVFQLGPCVPSTKSAGIPPLALLDAGILPIIPPATLVQLGVTSSQINVTSHGVTPGGASPP